MTRIPLEARALDSLKMLVQKPPALSYNKLNVRTFDAGVRKHVLTAIERIVNAEAEASGAPRKPEITPLDSYPLNVNDETASNRIAEAYRGYFSADRVRHTGPAPASEDFGCFGTAWEAPSVFWFVGGNGPSLRMMEGGTTDECDKPETHPSND
jgi:metal-dependent amidase/aminoacylase/carboxypeptidase family protein